MDVASCKKFETHLRSLPRFIVGAELVIIELPTKKQIVITVNSRLLEHMVYYMISCVCSPWKIRILSHFVFAMFWLYP